MWLTDIADKKPIPGNFTRAGMLRPIQGLVLHIEQGTEKGTYLQFKATSLQLAQAGDKPASAHFGNPRRGRMQQFVDTADMAWAQMAGNRNWISLENEGDTGNHLNYLTDSQIQNAALLFAWLHWNLGVPFSLANKPSDFGLGYHSMGGGPWGAGKSGHFFCPGLPVVQQRSKIIDIASAIPASTFGIYDEAGTRTNIA